MGGLGIGDSSGDFETGDSVGGLGICGSVGDLEAGDLKDSEIEDSAGDFGTRDSVDSGVDLEACNARPSSGLGSSASSSRS